MEAKESTGKRLLNISGMAINEKKKISIEDLAVG